MKNTLYILRLTFTLLFSAKEAGLNTAIETSGYVSPEILERFVPYDRFKSGQSDMTVTDLFVAVFFCTLRVQRIVQMQSFQLIETDHTVKFG